MSRNRLRAALLGCWLASFPILARTQSFLEAVFGTDYAGLIAACMVAMAASIVRTGLALLSPRPVPPGGVLREFARDTAYAFCAGGFVFVVVEVMRQEQVWQPQRMTWMLMIGAAGVLRADVFVWFGRSLKDVGAAAAERVTGAVKGKP